MASALLIAYSGSSYAIESDQVDYYFALDGQWHTVKLRPSWETMFNNTAFGSNIAFGIRPSMYYGLEFGFEWTTRKTKTTTLANGATLAGLTNTSGGQLSIDSQLRMITTNADVTGFLPLHESWEALGYVGVGWARFKPKYNLSVPGTNFDTLHSLGSKTRSYLRVGLGVQGLVTDTFGVRFKVGYNATGKVKFRYKDVQNTANDAPTESSYTIGLGGYFYV